MCACVITIDFTVSPCRCTISRMLSISSPGSTTMASRVVSSPKIEQLHCNMPTGRISWIIRYPIVYSRYGRYPDAVDAVGSHFQRDYAHRRRVVLAVCDGSLDEEDLARGLPGAGRRRRGAFPAGGVRCD